MIRFDVLEEYIEQSKSEPPAGLVSMREQIESIDPKKLDIDLEQQRELHRQLQTIAEGMKRDRTNYDFDSRTQQLKNLLNSMKSFRSSSFFDLISAMDKKNIDSSIEKLTAWILFDREVNFVWIGSHKLGSFEGFKMFVNGLEKIAEIVDKYWSWVDFKQKTTIEKMYKEIWLLMRDKQNERIGFLNSVSERRQTIREIVGFTLWRIQELKEQEIVQAREEKRQEALDKLKARVESNRSATPEGEQDLENFKKIIDNYRPVGQKVYAKDNC